MSQTPATLQIIGTPLRETGTPSQEALKAMDGCDWWIGESRKMTLRWFGKLENASAKARYFLDNIADADKADLMQALESAATRGESVALLSDGGMPSLFDPGSDVIQEAVRLGIKIDVVPAPTSWATACAASGWTEPFYLHGFLPRDAGERREALLDLKKIPAHIVLLEAPYRLAALLSACAETWGRGHAAFLAWEIDSPDAAYSWLSIGEMANRMQNRKGEFVLILSKSKPPKSLRQR